MKEIYELRQKQSLPLEAKINMSLSRINAWLDYCMGGGEFDSEGFWRPSASGLGFWFIFEWAKKNLNLDYKF